MKMSVNELRTRLKENRYSAAAVFPLYILFSWFFDNWFAGGAFAVAIVYVVESAHARYAGALSARIETADSPTWDVEVNQVKAGTITDADYAAIRLRVFYDFRTYVSQLMNLFRVALNSFDYCYRAIPLGLFWVAVGLAVFSPEMLSSVLTAIHDGRMNDVQRSMSEAGRVLLGMMSLSVVLPWIAYFGERDR